MSVMEVVASAQSASGHLLVELQAMGVTFETSARDFLVDCVAEPPHAGLTLDCLWLPRTMEVHEIATLMSNQSYRALPLENLGRFINQFRTRLRESSPFVFLDPKTIQERVLIATRREGQIILTLSQEFSLRWSKRTMIPVVCI